MENTQQAKLGVTAYEDGIHFGLWAPFADSVFISGDFNNWSETDTPLTKLAGGNWGVVVDNAQAGQQYKYVIINGKQKLLRNDPRSLQLTAAQDASIIVDSTFDWQNDDFRLPPKNQQVIYELHVGTFSRTDPATPGTFETAEAKLDYLQNLGINVIELLPINGTNMERWWGYEPTYLYSVEAAYGGRKAFQQFVREAHKRGIGVIIDVVYNHLSPQPNFDLWRFDGWTKPGKGGIYFYSDSRIETPWGPRPDYGRPEVREYITDSARMWIEECHVDGLRADAIFAIRNSKGYNDNPENDIPDGWQLLQDINTAVHQINPKALTVAEDVACNSHVTKSVEDNGAGFDAQWETTFPAMLRAILNPINDDERNLQPLVDALQKNYDSDDVFKRVIYSESHDADANGNARMNSEINPSDADGLFARKRSMLAAAIMLSAPGIPMLFQGQEFMEDGWFNHWNNLNWDRADQFVGTVQFYRDVIALRRNQYGYSVGLQEQAVSILQFDEVNKILAYTRGGTESSDSIIVIVINFTNNQQLDYQLNFPHDGIWKICLNSDWQGYSPDFTNLHTEDVVVHGLVGVVNLAPYSVLFLSR